MSFSAKFKNKAVRAKQKSLDSTFNNLGNKIKELGLDPEKEKVIIDILDDAYTVKHIELMTAASKGEIKETAKPTPAPEPTVNTDAELASALGGAVNGAEATATTATTKTGGNKGGGSKNKNK